jgi:DMSO reductase iron-sulfur subunit
MLPLLERASAQGETYVLTKGRMGSHAADALVEIQLRGSRQLIPERRPGPGEQYRFHFDMTKCVGCKCCVVACNEQNGNPGDLHWRRVGEIEGGYYPDTHRWYLSMGCNHCLEPACLTGCPVEAYDKNPITGVVQHDPDICIGCQYCTWNCSYGVPQYNPERGVVGKCDLCHNRLSDGDAPACVEACPQGAIQVEIVNIGNWLADHATADGPGLPSSSDSLSTTRVTLPADMPADVDRVDRQQSRLEDPHWPLVFMLTLTQMSVGAIVIIWTLATWHRTDALSLAAALTLGTAFLSFLSSTLHLGRPVHGYRAVKGWRRSWLSREVVSLGLFANAAAVYGAYLFFGVKGGPLVGTAAIALGIAGIYCSARVYLVPARPAWNSGYTITDFFLTGALLGPLFVSAAGVPAHSTLAAVAAAAACAQLVNQISKLLWLSREEDPELRASALLLIRELRIPFLLRLGLLLLGGIVLPLISTGPWVVILTLLLALAAELVGRWLFFVGVTPKNIAAGFLIGGRAA